MPKFTLISEHTDLYGNFMSKTTHEFEVDGLPEVLDNVDLFLRGTGYNPSGNLDYVPDAEYYGTGPEWQTEDFATPQEDMAEWNKVHSNYYFDTERNK